MKTLADKLDDIALGNNYDSQALLQAKQHTVTTSNDKLLIDRFLFGNTDCTDHCKLQQIAIYIRDWEQTNANK